MRFIENYKTFRSKYIVQQRRPEEYFFNKYYAHLIDPFFTKVAYDLKLRPNTVTLISALFGICSGISLVFGYYIVAGFLLQLHHLLDGADGNLARLTNHCTDFGAKLDKYCDQIVRIVVLIGIVIAADASVLTNLLFLATFALDLLLIHKFVLPFIRKNGIRRAKWKRWFLSKGIIPAFDIFTIYFCISIFAFLQRPDLLIYVLLIMKTVDWLYRVWECVKTKFLLERNGKST